MDFPSSIRIVRLRWAILGLCLLAGGALYLGAVELPWPALALVACSLASANLVWSLASGSARWAALDVQLGVDFLCLTALLYLTGGPANPLVSMYLLLIALAAQAMPAIRTWLLAAASMLAYALLFRWHQPIMVAGEHSDMLISLHLAGMWLTFCVCGIVLAGPLARLSRTVREREQELGRIRETQLRDEKLVALGMIAAGAAHELGTPLNTLTLLADDLAERYAGDPELDDDIRLMRNQLGACRRALGRLKQQGGELASPAEPVSQQLGHLVANWRNLRPQIELDYQPALASAPTQWFDPSFGPALLNLLNNAADASPDGRITVQADWRAPMLVIRIRHTGSLPPQLELGHPAMPVTSSKQHGMGLGIFLAHATLDKLGGTLQMESDARGVCTTLALPLPTPHAVAHP